MLTNPAPVKSRRDKRRLAVALLDKSRRVGGSPAGQLDLLTWTVLHRGLLVPDRPLDFRRHQYLLGIYRCTARRRVFKKASQMGLSEYAVSYLFHTTAERDGTVLYIMPTERHVSDFSSGRVGPAIEASPHIARLIVTGNAAGEEGADRVTVKRIGNRFAYFRGGQVKKDGRAPQLKSIDADAVVYDELDEIDPRVRALGGKRLEHSLLREELYISTPTYAGFGIDAVYAESDQREWYVPCPHCGERQPLRREQLILEYDELERPVRWHGQAEGRAFVACRRCGQPLDRLAAGEWVAAFPARPLAGFHVTRLFSAYADLDAMVADLQTTSETKRREALNQDFGETYAPRGGRLTDVALDAARREYAHGVRPGEAAVMGVDVGAALHVIIRGTPHPETGERPQRYAGEVESFDRLGALMREYGVAACVVDALPETRAARAFQETQPDKIWLAYYTGTRIGSKSPSPAAWDEKKGVVNLDRTRLLDDTLGRFYSGENTLPADARDIRNYYSQLKAPVRVIEDTPTGKAARYVESEADHYAHAENYCTAASLVPDLGARWDANPLLGYRG